MFFRNIKRLVFILNFSLYLLWLWLMLRISATAATYLKNRRRGILPRPQRVHRNCTPFLHEPWLFWFSRGKFINPDVVNSIQADNMF